MTSIYPNPWKKKNYVPDVFFINDENQRVYVHSHYSIICDELQKLGIDTKDITISDLLTRFDPLLVIKHNEIVKDINYLDHLRTYNAFHNKIRVLHLSIIEVAFHLYDYDADQMPSDIEKLFLSKYK
jgi:hypothetical protein